MNTSYTEALTAAEENAYQTMAERHPAAILGGPNSNTPMDSPLWTELDRLIVKGIESFGFDYQEGRQ